MFYLYFTIVFLVVLISLWIVYWLYRIVKIKHNAQNLYGRLFRLYDKRHDIIEKFINDYKNQKQIDLLQKIVTLKELSKKERDLNRKLQIEHDIGKTINEISENSEVEEKFRQINSDIYETVKSYNFFVSLLENISQKKSAKLLIKVFGIGLMNKIEV